MEKVNKNECALIDIDDLVIYKQQLEDKNMDADIKIKILSKLIEYYIPMDYLRVSKAF